MGISDGLVAKTKELNLSDGTIPIASGSTVTFHLGNVYDIEDPLYDGD